jgi:hypothetical protein
MAPTVEEQRRRRKGDDRCLAAGDDRSLSGEAGTP